VSGSKACGLMKWNSPVPAIARPDNCAMREFFLGMDVLILSDQVSL
jgi:hypothetical protein